MKVIIGLATRGDDICAGVVSFVLSNQKVHNSEFVWKACSWSAPLAQEAVFQEAAKLKPDYLFMMDSDVIPPNDVIEKLIARDKDVICAPVWHYDPLNGLLHIDACKELNNYIYLYGDGLEEIRSTSFSCLLISGKVLEAFSNNNHSFVTWSSLIDIKYSQCSSDVIFFEKVRALGFKIWVDWEIRSTEHYRRIHLGERVLGNYLGAMTK